jgi:hypothetical protein
MHNMNGTPGSDGNSLTIFGTLTQRASTGCWTSTAYTIIKKKDYHSEVIKAKLKRIPIAGLFARIIAKMYSGTSVAVIAKQTDIA